MKSFYTALAILLLILISVLIISANITKELTHLLDFVSNLPSAQSDEMNHTYQYPNQLLHEWERAKSFLSLTISRTEIMQVESSIYNMNEFYNLNYVHEYNVARVRLYYSIQALLDSEQFWWKNIL